MCASIALAPKLASAAVVFAGSAVGSWGSFAGGADNPNPNVTETNFDNSTIAKIVFGTPTDPRASGNYFTFDGAGSNAGSAVPAFSATAGTLFDIGRFSYYNGTTTLGTSIDSVKLGIKLTLTAPSDASPPSTTYSYDFGIDITPNTGNAQQNADIVTIDSGLTTTTFTSGGQTYTLMLKGFSTDGGKTYTTSFKSLEDSLATADIYAVIIPPPPTSVPEPLSLALLGTGLAGLGLIRRRDRRATT